MLPIIILVDRSTWEIEASGSLCIQGQHGLYSELQAKQDYIMRFHLKTIISTNQSSTQNPIHEDLIYIVSIGCGNGLAVGVHSLVKVLRLCVCIS